MVWKAWSAAVVTVNTIRVLKTILLFSACAFVCACGCAQVFGFTSVHFCSCACVFILLQASCIWPIFPHCVLSTPLGRKTREINYVSCWWAFDVKSWGKRCSVTFSLHLLCVIQRVQLPQKSPSPLCCLVPALSDIHHIIRADRKFDFSLAQKDVVVLGFFFFFLGERAEEAYNRNSRTNNLKKNHADKFWHKNYFNLGRRPWSPSQIISCWC